MLKKDFFLKLIKLYITIRNSIIIIFFSTLIYLFWFLGNVKSLFVYITYYFSGSLKYLCYFHFNFGALLFTLNFYLFYFIFVFRNTYKTVNFVKSKNINYFLKSDYLFVLKLNCVEIEFRYFLVVFVLYNTPSL